MKKLRTDMLEGRKPPSCVKCFEQEDNKITSFRQNANCNFESHIPAALEDTKPDGHVDDFKLVYWDFRFSNLCNMKCRMCGGHLSSLWNADEKQLYGHASEPEVVVNTREKCVDDLYQVLNEQMSNLEEIYFAGGEPLIMEEHYYILERLIEQGRTDVRLRYNTNLSKLKYKKWDLIKLWSHFDSVHVVASIDAIGDRAEYIRKGTVWPTVEKNLKQVISMRSTQFLVGVSPTVQALNIKHIPDFVDYLMSLGLPANQIHLNNVLTNPQWYHVNTLSNADKQEVQELLKEHLQTLDDTARKHIEPAYNSIISYMSGTATTEVLQKFVLLTEQLDKIRSESFVDTFPELNAHWQRCINI
jgi:sulfatase maturation enzyme AslB (radical SAM superfamily)